MFTNNYTMTDYTYNLFQQVIDAAKEGRYCHGNGAIWCIVEKQLNGSIRNVVINTSETGYNNQLGTKQYVDTANPVDPYVAMTTANNLESFLDRQQGFVGNLNMTSKEYGYSAMLTREIREAVNAGKEGRCLHFNGGQLYYKRSNELIRVVDFSIRGIIQISDFGQLATRNYMRFGFDPSAARSANKYWAEEAMDFFAGRLVAAAIC
jgi:hypothetical protein